MSPKMAGKLRFLVAIALSVALLESPAAAQQRGSGNWVTAWGSSQHVLSTSAITNATVRMMARVTLGGEQVRVRLDNTLGTSPVAIGRAYVGLRLLGAVLAPGSNRQVFFRGSASVTIPAGGSIVSDATSLHVFVRQDVAVSLYIPDADVRPSGHAGAQVTSYLTPNVSGDLAADESGAPFTNTTTSMFWLKGIDVFSPVPAGAIVAFGDSITDGTCSTLDAQNRWEDWLAIRFNLELASGRLKARRAVVNEGIGGNTLTRENLQPPPDSTPGLERLERDVLSHQGVSHVILFMGTNDIRREASAAQVIAGMQEVIKRVKARHIKIIGTTIIPRHNAPPSGTNTGWSPAKTQIRNEVNQWIRTKAPFDGVIDFDKVIRDPANPDLMTLPFNCGDGIHPTTLGYYEMGKFVNLALFQ
jgi:lysophospholipase L1-like esterase